MIGTIVVDSIIVILTVVLVMLSLAAVFGRHRSSRP
jgi:hypothetical protein